MSSQKTQGDVLERTCRRCANQWAVPVRIAVASGTISAPKVRIIEGASVALRMCRSCGAVDHFTEVVLR